MLSVKFLRLFSLWLCQVENHILCQEKTKVLVLRFSVLNLIRIILIELSDEFYSALLCHLRFEVNIIWGYIYRLRKTRLQLFPFLKNLSALNLWDPSPWFLLLHLVDLIRDLSNLVFFQFEKLFFFQIDIFFSFHVFSISILVELIWCELL